MRRPLTALIIAAALAVCASATAAVVRQLSLKDMASLADLVVEGQVEAVEAQWLEGRIFRKVTVVAQRVVKGPLKAGQPITLWAPGGEVGNLGQWVAGAPEFEVGESTVLFLEPRPIGYVVVGLSLGKLRTERDDAGAEWVVRDLIDGMTAAPLKVSWGTLQGTVRTAK